jgi:hypothetical protein
MLVAASFLPSPRLLLATERETLAIEVDEDPLN